MFGKLYAAKLRDVRLTTKKIKGEDDSEPLAIITMNYDFTEELAAAIGGAAPALQAMLSAGGDGVKVSRAGVVLDVKDVAVQFKAADKEAIKIEHTRKLKVRAQQPNAEDTGPTLAALIAFTMGEDDDDSLLFFRRNMDRMLKVRMDRKQLDLPATKGGGEEPAEVEE